MIHKRDLLQHFTRDELASVADTFELEVSDRRVKDNLIDAVAGSKKATLGAILPDLSRDRLKELCRACDIDDSGRAKSDLIERLLGGTGKEAPKEASFSKATKPKKMNGASRTAQSPELNP